METSNLNPVYNCDYFIKKFEGIPESKWNVGDFHDGDKHCALGHCSMEYSKENRQRCGCPYGEEMNSLVALFGESWSLATSIEKLIIVNINDNRDSRYTQPSAKQRILAALYDIKKMQQPAPYSIDLRKSLAVLEDRIEADIVNVKNEVV